MAKSKGKHKKGAGRVTAALAAPILSGELIPPRAAATELTPATPRIATSLPAVWSCVEIITTTGLLLPLVAHVDGKPVPLPEWLRVPERYNDGAASLAEIVEHAVIGQALHGAGYFWATPVGDMSWTLRPIDPDRVTAELVERQHDTAREWRLDGRRVDTARRFSTRANRAGLLAIPHRYLPGVADPIGPIQAARYSVAGYLSTEAYGADVFGSGVPQGVLTTPQDITPATGERYRDEWMNGARNPVRVLGNGLTFNAFKLSPKDAAWIEARRFDSEEVARLYGVPAYKLNLQQSGGMVYSNASEMDRDFLRSCVAGGYLKPVERALNALTPAGRNASEELAITFDYSSFLEPTTAELFDTYAVAITNGILTVNEVRERLKLAPLPEPDPEPAAPPAITEAPAAIPPAAESAAAGSVPADDNADDTPTEAAE